jgi:hypothetical protein
VLAAAARAVNDRLSDAGRARLMALAPRLAGTARADWLVGARLVVLCAEAALASADVTAVRSADAASGEPRWMVLHVPPRLPAEVWQELAGARRTARYLLAHEGAVAAERARCPWRVRVTIWLLDRVGLLKSAYPFDAALQVAFAIAQVGSTSDPDAELLALLEACVGTCTAACPEEG